MSSVTRRLMERASRRVAWHWLETNVAGRPVRIATASDPDGMLLDACRRQDAGEVGVIDPFWATTWRAADGLDQFLEARNLDSVRVLELGCGTGRAGLGAALRGAWVTLTDGVSDPLLLVKLTISLCLKRGLPLPVPPEGQVPKDQPAFQAEPSDFIENCEVRRLRFAEDTLEQPPFPIILGSDITYSRDLWPKLDVCMRHHLAENGEVLLSDPYRSISTEFASWIARRKWQYEEHRMILPDDATRPIRVMRLTR